MFDINLLSQIQALDRKFSVANERPRLKRKAAQEHRQKDSDLHEGKGKNSAVNSRQDNLIDETVNNHTNIDITV